MKVLISRISEGKVLVDTKIVASVGRGLAVFVGIEKTDTAADLVDAARKIVTIRVFENEEGKMHLSVKDTGYEILCVSNFTLCAATDKGRRPSFDASMPPAEAKEMFDNLILLLKQYEVDVKAGVFGEHMDIAFTMDGPVNIVL